ncbi:MAG TPA: protein kinase [Gemmatimonadaceae bacterium]|nr:protein kinase [Gemmatimonadaceae bacterium]
MTDPLRDRVIVAVGDLYDVDAEVGRGGMAVVYRATDLRLRRAVAIKVLPPDLAFRADVRERFLREAQTAAQLNHPNIVPIYSVDERGGLVYFVMGLVDGESLAARAARAPLPLGDVRRVLREVADALSYAHARGVIHRDIKPDNILLERTSGRAMVTDFGIARAAEADSRLTVTGVAVGTPAYMSPEQALGERELDGRSDLYSLGVVGYQLVSGQLPFRAANGAAIMMKHISEPPRRLRELRPDVSPALASVIERALAKRPEDRFHDAAAMRDALASEAPVPLPPASPLPTPAPAEIPWQHRAAEVPGRPPRRESPAPGAGAPAAGGVLAPPLPPVPWPMSRRAAAREMRRQREDAELARFESRPIDDRIRFFRRQLASTTVVVGTLAVVNFATSPHFPWFLFPALGMGGGVFRQWLSLWESGVTWKRLFTRKPSSETLAPGEPAAPAISVAAEAAAKMVPREVLDGPHGRAVRDAAADRLAILAIVESLAKPDRALLPDIVPTVNALAQRVASLAVMLHHLDADTSPEALSRLESRIVEVKGEPEDSADRERRLSLLERQYASLRELTERHRRLSGQLESAGIALQNLKLDLLKLRSSGVQAALSEVTSATIEARALSRDIGHVLEAAAEVRKI